MRRIKKIFMLFILSVLSAGCIFVFVSCGNNGYGDLEAPKNLRIENEVLIWDEVEGAKGYTVKINEAEYDTRTNSLDIFTIATVPETVYSMQVQSRAALAANNDSEMSEAVEYKINGWQQTFALYPINDDTEYGVRVADKTAIGGKIVLPQVAPDGKKITEIGNNAFQDCKQITGILISDSVVKIGNHAFAGCEKLSRIYMPAKLKTIGRASFRGCSNLPEIKIPEYVEKISSVAFAETGITELEIPASVIGIESNLTSGCDKLISLTVDARNIVYKSDGNCVIRNRDNTLVFGCNKSVIPEYITSIANYAFSNCRLLESAVIPSGVKILPDGVFSNCSSLKYVKIEEGVQTIISNVLGGTFHNCNALESLEIPASVTNLEGNIFANMPALKNVVVHLNNPIYKSDGNCIIRKSDGVLVAGCVGSIIPDYITEIGECAFRGRAIKDILLPNGLKIIGKSAFRQSSLERIVFPEGLNIIKNYAFDECSGLMDYWIVLHKNITIEENAFFTANNLFTEDSRDQINYEYRYKIVEGVMCEENGEKYIKEFKYSGEVNMLAPYRRGYVFKGWTSRENGTVAEFGAPFAINDKSSAEERSERKSAEIYCTINFEEWWNKPVPNGTTLYSVWELESE